MLRELRIRDYAVISDLTLELEPGLNVLTGETGAGKSILVEALALLLGERASSEAVRSGQSRALVEGTFDVSAVPTIRVLCEAAGIALEDGWLILRREVQREGRNRAWVNGSPATAGLVSRLGDVIVDLHGQHEHQALLRRDVQRRMLDEYAGASDLATRVDIAHATVLDLAGQLEHTRRQTAAAVERAEYLRFQAGEIEEAKLEAGEEDSLRAEERRLGHSEELLALSDALHGTVYRDEDSLVDRLGALRRRLADLERIDPATADLGELYGAALAALEELGRRSGEYHAGVEHDPARLAAVRERLDLLHRLSRKYGGSVEDVLAVGAAARAELDEIEMSGAAIARLEKALSRESELLREQAEELTKHRTAAAERLAGEVSALLPELGMPNGEFRVVLEPVSEPGRHGFERVEFRVRLNPGIDIGPLARVASGGELSRVMLALKAVLAEVDAVPCLIFDEIDAGIGGRVAHRVGARLSEVATRHQVLVVTHLPQIAARAAAHHQVEKSESGGIVVTKARRLEGVERIEELARMLGGDPESELSRRHAEELLSEDSHRDPQAAGHGL